MPARKFLQAIFLSSIFIFPVHAQEASDMTDIEIPIPSGFVKQNEQPLKSDGDDVILTRHIRSDHRNTHPGGEHFSTLYRPDGKLKGFVNITYDLVGKSLPDKEKAERIARDFLQHHAPDLLDGLELHWVAPHDEPIRISHLGEAREVTLTGMKVKMRNKQDGLWFWVIVGGDERVMVFERDIGSVFPGSAVLKNGCMTVFW